MENHQKSKGDERPSHTYTPYMYTHTYTLEMQDNSLFPPDWEEDKKWESHGAYNYPRPSSILKKPEIRRGLSARGKEMF